MKTSILGIDTCSFWMNLSLVDEAGVVLGEVHEKAATHTTGLVPAIEAMLKRCGSSAAEISGIGVVTGPGSFTGLRVGIATAQGYAGARGIPVWGMGSLEALATFAPGEGEGWALLDARRNKVYGARFESVSGHPPRVLAAEKDLSPEEVLQGGQVPAWAVGDGVPLVNGWPEGCVLLREIPNLAVASARHSLAALLHGKPAQRLEARYVRAPDAALPGRVPLP